MYLPYRRYTNLTDAQIEEIKRLRNQERLAPMAGKVDENKQQEGLEREYAPIISAQEATTNKMNDLIELIRSGAPEHQIRRAVEELPDRKSVV